MNYNQFEDLPVWNTSIDLAVRVFELTSTGCVSRYSGFKNQLERCVVSISNNIAEGFERGTHEELLTFLYIARGSTGETRSMLSLLEKLIRNDERLPQINELKELTLSVTRQLNAWLDSLKKTKAVGHRNQTPERKESMDNARRRDEFLAYLQRVQEEHQTSSDRSADE